MDYKEEKNKSLFGYSSHGEMTRAVQRYCGIVADGYFGPKTRAAVKEHQRKFNLPMTGVIDTAFLTIVFHSFLDSVDKVVDKINIEVEEEKPNDITLTLSGYVDDITNSLPRKTIQQIEYSERKGIVLHHSATFGNLEGSHPKGYANYHVKSLGWNCIAYTYVVQPSGDIYKTLELTDKGYHAGTSLHQGDENKEYYGICLSGNYDRETVSNQSYDKVTDAIVDLIHRHREASGNDSWLPELVRHDDFNYKKSCPGLNFDMDEIKKRLKERGF